MNSSILRLHHRHGSDKDSKRAPFRIFAGRRATRMQRLTCHHRFMTGKCRHRTGNRFYIGGRQEQADGPLFEAAFGIHRPVQPAAC
ncbi:hypothetical protein [Tardiphaga sp.]|uniref:hypothetical protein n=1 Tax=Tardiphaga sp. TaxID=1926292 RepID=UPI0025F9A3D9|nr:hypothetical protein [Tardiphaga sp.]